MRKTEKMWRRRDTKEGGWERQKETRRSVFSVFARVRSAGGEKIKVETLLLKFGRCKKKKRKKSKRRKGGGERERKKKETSAAAHMQKRAHKAALSLMLGCSRGGF